jgi:hypothetical protein
MFFASIANAEVRVSPTMIELDANKFSTDYITASLTVQAGANETIRFKIYPEYFKISPEGTMDVQKDTEANDSLAKNIRFVPNEFTLTNGRVQKIRITVTDLKSLQNGESRVVLFLEDVAVKEVNLPNSYKNVNTKLIVKTRVGVPVYVDKGRVIKNANIEELKVENKEDNLISHMKLSSDGNSRVRFSGKAQVIKGKSLIEEFPIKRGVIGSHNTLTLQEIIPTADISENGEYTLRMILNYTDEKGKVKKMTKEATFKYDGVKPSAI